jgi:tetratricopeptide (TPR) repeat protein
MEEPYILSAIVGFYFFGMQCDEAISKVTTAIQLGGSVDTLSGAARIYGVCGDYARAIEVSKQALIRVPHDAGWSITRNLVAYYYLNGQEDEVQALIGDNINAPDMHGEVLFYFAYASEKRGDLEKAQEYLDRAKQAGTSIKNFKRSFIIKSDSHEIMQSLERLGLDQTSF